MTVPTVVTIHDLIPLDLPQDRHPMQVKRFEQSVRCACRRATWIVCPSLYTRDRLVEQFDADASRITVNHWAPACAVAKINEVALRQVLQRYGVQSPFVLHFGAAAPRKNTLRLIHAWADLHETVRREWQLLIVGLDWRAQTVVQDLVEQSDLQDSVVVHGFAAEEDLPALQRGASALAYPSLSEGFGLPILDAWAAGTAVLSSNTTSIPEIAGDAALLVDPTDTAAIAEGLEQLTAFASLRAELVARGRRRVQQFTWHATAHRFIDALEQARALGDDRDRPDHSEAPCPIQNTVST